MSTNDKLPDFFPKAPKVCREPANKFFECFTINSEKSSPTDTEAGQRGLAKCLLEKEAYEKCMLKFEKTHPPKRYR